jgi:hypothetical protein
MDVIPRIRGLLVVSAMSYLLSVKRVISVAEVTALVEGDPSLRITRRDEDTLDLFWSADSEQGFFQLVQGDLQSTTPSAAAAHKLAAIAESLGASVVGEEDLIPLQGTQPRQGLFAGRSTWIGWPLLVLVLAVLLIWRW